MVKEHFRVEDDVREVEVNVNNLSRARHGHSTGKDDLSAETCKPCKKTAEAGRPKKKVDTQKKQVDREKISKTKQREAKMKKVQCSNKQNR